MRIKGNFRYRTRPTLFLVFMAVFALCMSPENSPAEILTESYCRLSVQNLEQEVSNFQSLISLATLYKDDPQAFARQEEIKQAEYEQVKTTLFSAYGMTDKEFATYMSENGRDVNAYLDDNPVLKQQIDELSGKVILLMEQFEALKSALNSPPELPPE